MEQDWIFALIGGVIIGTSATLMLFGTGRIMGVSGIFFGAIHPLKGDTLWRVKFILGLISGGLLGFIFIDDPFSTHLDTSPISVIIAGLLVGYGTRLGSGCTSGHGICGISRLSVRSIVATVSFILSGALTVLFKNLISGGL